MRTPDFYFHYEGSDTDFKRGWVALLCSARAHPKTVSQHFHELLRISIRQVFTFLSCTAPHCYKFWYPHFIHTCFQSSAPKQRLSPLRYQMRGRISKKPEPPQPVSSQESQQPSCSYCLQCSSPHLAFGNHACQVSWIYIQNQAGSQIFGLDFQ